MKKDRAFWRENKIDCNQDWRAVEIFKYSDRPSTGKARRPKSQLSTPAQQNLNEKRSRRYFVQLILANFCEGDYVVHLTYSDKYLPQTTEAAGKILRRWLDRIAYTLKKRGLPPMQYIAVTAQGTIHQRIHHHVFLRCLLDRDELENMWWAVKGTKKTKREMLGGANVDRLKDWSGDGIYEMAVYVARQTKGKKKWTQSQNLKRPKLKRANDSKYRQKTMTKLLELQPDSPEFQGFLTKNYPGWKAIRVEIEQPKVEEWAWAGGIYLLLRRSDT